MRNQLSFIAIMTLLVLSAAACQRNSQQASSSDLVMTVETMDSAVGETMLMVTVTDAEGQPIDDATVDIKGDMTHAGMVPVLAIVEGGTEGVYTLPFEWTMAGDWIVTVNVSLPDGSRASQQFDGFSISGEGTTIEDDRHDEMHDDATTHEEMHPDGATHDEVHEDAMTHEEMHPTEE